MNSPERVPIALARAKLLDVEQLGWVRAGPPLRCAPLRAVESPRKEEADLWESRADGSDRPHAPDPDVTHTKNPISKCRWSDDKTQG